MSEMTYFLNVEEFTKSFTEIPTNPVDQTNSTTNGSTYLAGIANLYDSKVPNQSVGRCSASFLCLSNGQNKKGKGVIYTDISNYVSVDNGLIVSWFTPTTLANLELESIIHSMVNESLVMATTKIGAHPLYGEQLNLVVSSQHSSEGKHQIWFTFTQLN